MGQEQRTQEMKRRSALPILSNLLTHYEIKATSNKNHYYQDVDLARAIKNGPTLSQSTTARESIPSALAELATDTPKLRAPKTTIDFLENNIYRRPEKLLIFTSSPTVSTIMAVAWLSSCLPISLT